MALLLPIRPNPEVNEVFSDYQSEGCQIDS